MQRKISKQRCLIFVASLAVGGVLWFGCGDDGNGNGNGNGNGAAQNMTVQGTAQRLSDQGQASPLSGATVEARVDRNEDGTIDADERAQTQTDGDGNYSVDIAAVAERRLVVSFRASGLADQHKTVQIDEVADVRINASLSPTETLDCQGTRCSNQDRSLQVSGLPEGVTGTGRTFNPVIDVDAFPGEFEDDSGNLLVSGVFANVDLQDQQGNAVDTLEEPAELRMRFPRDTWEVIRDIEADNGQIDVPLYAFDEASGEWKRDGRAVIVDSDDEVVAESELPAIRDGSFSGVIYASGEVEHFSYWNVDWPIESHGSLRGTITLGPGVGSGSGPAEGGQLSVSGVSYTGSSGTQTIPASGEFCVDVLRSETAGEDVDGDGQSGETQTVAVRVTFDGALYDLGVVEVATEQSSCQQGDSQDLGALELTTERELEAELCAFDVSVVDLEDKPVAGAFVYAFDTNLPAGVFQELCFDSEDPQACKFSASTDENGEAQLSTPVIDRLTAYSQVSGVNPEAETSVRTGTRVALGCPSEPVVVRLDQGYDFFELEVALNGQVISWQPALAAQGLFVGSSGNPLKWWLGAGAGGFEPPVTYGEVPEGAQVIFPFDGSDPEPLASGDEIFVNASGSSDEGIFEYYSGEVAVE